MSLRSASPLSDGELSRSEDGKKVYKNAHTSKNTNVDPSARHSTSSSRSSRYDRNDRKYAVMYDMNAHFNDYGRDRSRSRSRSPFRHDRSRSRSPYRADKDTGREKRRRQDDHYGKGASDPRRHKVYEDGPARGHGGNTYRESDRQPQSRGGHGNHNNNFDQRGRGRGNTHDSHGNRDRDRSRSPYRAPAGNNSRPRSRQGPNSPGNSWDQAGNMRRGSTASFQRESTPQASRKDAADTKMSSSQSEKKAAASQDATQESEQAEEQEPEQKLSEAEIIEQRRKKREAIRQKHKMASSDSLLRTTLEGNLPSSAATPQTESANASQPQSPTSPSSAGSPATPKDSTSAPASPADFPEMKDEDLANPLQVNAAADEQGQSAADYDPAQDMNEDRPEFKQHVQEEFKAQEESKVTAPPKKKSADDFDMFAEDDDDMFAFDEGPTQATAKQARALDESLLDNWDYPDGHYRIIHGELLHNRYAVEQQLGKGTFATVVRATDTNTGTKVAIKIACRNDTMLKAGQKEMQFVQRLNDRDPEDKRHIIRLLGDFMHKGHLCLVFEGLQMDMRELVKKFGRDRGIKLDAVRVYAYQMFLALLLMKNAEVLHADLKPDNILVHERNGIIKICDFGTATLQQDAELTPYLVSRFYRAPEVIIGMDFDYAIDMWAIGCTLYELYVGRILFNGSDNNNMLRVIQECRGKLPNRLVKRAKLRDKYFDDDNVFYGFERDKMTGNMVPRAMHFAQGHPGKDLKSRLGGNTKHMTPAELKEHTAFVDLLDKCLQLDPDKRIKPKEALQHYFFKQGQEVKPRTAVASTPFRPSTVHRGG